jgi:hypothetical protein
MQVHWRYNVFHNDDVVLNQIEMILSRFLWLLHLRTCHVMIMTNDKVRMDLKRDGLQKRRWVT